jgi:hypothetical protein
MTWLPGVKYRVILFLLFMNIVFFPVLSIQLFGHSFNILYVRRMKWLKWTDLFYKRWTVLANSPWRHRPCTGIDNQFTNPYLADCNSFSVNRRSRLLRSTRLCGFRPPPWQYNSRPDLTLKERSTVLRLFEAVLWMSPVITQYLLSTAKKRRSFFTVLFLKG